MHAYIYIYVYIGYTYVLTYIIHAYIRAYIRAYVHTYIRTYARIPVTIPYIQFLTSLYDSTIRSLYSAPCIFCVFQLHIMIKFKIMLKHSCVIIRCLAKLSHFAFAFRCRVVPRLSVPGHLTCGPARGNLCG